MGLVGQSPQSRMKCILLSALVAAVSASPFNMAMDQGMPVAPEYNSHSDRLNEMIDVVESGLSSEPEGRLLFIGATATVTSYTSTVTLTTTMSVKASCYSPTPDPLPECAATTTTTTATTTTTVAPGGRALNMFLKR